MKTKSFFDDALEHRGIMGFVFFIAKEPLVQTNTYLTDSDRLFTDEVIYSSLSHLMCGHFHPFPHQCDPGCWLLNKITIFFKHCWKHFSLF